MEGKVVKYSYALLESNRIVNVNELEKKQRHKNKYFCCGCGKELIPRLGEKREKHFAHKIVSSAYSCSFESYLHRTAKYLLYQSIKEKIKEGQPFYLNYEFDIHCSNCHYPESGRNNCYLATREGRYNLLQQYHTIKLEKRVDEFIPDICLFRKNGDRIFIEIVVSHYSESSKIISGNKIIEIVIETESDLSYLNKNEVNPAMLGVKLHNFDFKVVNSKISKRNCPYGEKNIFFVTSNGKALLLTGLPYFKYYQIKNKEYPYFEEFKEIENEAEVFLSTVERAYSANIKILNCHLCRYHGYKTNYGIQEKTVFCKFRKIDIDNSNKAANCEYFRADEKAFYSNQVHN